MHCIFWSLYIILNVVHDNQPGKPWEIKERLLVYTVLYGKQYSVNMNWWSMKKLAPLSPLVSWWIADVCDHQMTKYKRPKRHWQYPNQNKIADQEWRLARMFPRFFGFDSTWFYFKLWLVRSLARFVGVVIGRSISFGLNSYYTHSKTASRVNWAPSRRCIWKNSGRSEASIHWACKVKFMNGWLIRQQPRWMLNFKLSLLTLMSRFSRVLLLLIFTEIMPKETVSSLK